MVFPTEIVVFYKIAVFTSNTKNRRTIVFAAYCHYVGRAKLSGACSGFPLLTHAFAGVPLLSLASLPLLDNGLLAVSSFS